MTIKEVYEKYKDMNESLSFRPDRSRTLTDINQMIISDMWQAIKEEVEKPECDLKHEKVKP